MMILLFLYLAPLRSRRQSGYRVVQFAIYFSNFRVRVLLLVDEQGEEEKRGENRDGDVLTRKRSGVTLGCRRRRLLLLLFRHRVPVNFSQQIAHRRRSSHERRRMMMWRRRAEKKASLVSLLLLIFLLPLYPLLLLLLWGVLLVVVGRRRGPRGGEKHDAVDTSHKAMIINVDFLFLFFFNFVPKSTLFRRSK